MRTADDVADGGERALLDAGDAYGDAEANGPARDAYGDALCPLRGEASAREPCERALPNPKRRPCGEDCTLVVRGALSSAGAYGRLDDRRGSMPSLKPAHPWFRPFCRFSRYSAVTPSVATQSLSRFSAVTRV